LLLIPPQGLTITVECGKWRSRGPELPEVSGGKKYGDLVLQGGGWARGWQLSL